MNALHLRPLALGGLPPSKPGYGLDPDWGLIRSEETGSALDGPGLRTVFCLDGSAQEPDTWPSHGARCVRVDTLVAEVEQYAELFAAVHGGVTLSGEEPLVQHAFCANLLRRLHGIGVHTVLDTHGSLASRLGDGDLRAIDLVILELDGTPLLLRNRYAAAVADFARRLHALARPTWIRFVLAPGLTDHPDDIAALARFCGRLSNVERLEVIPVDQRSRSGHSSAIAHIAPPSAEALQAVRETFRRHGSICPD